MNMSVSISLNVSLNLNMPRYIMNILVRIGFTVNPSENEKVERGGGERGAW